MTNNTLKTIAERFSCRNFKDESIRDEDLITIANAGIQAPSAMNRQHWQVIVVKDRNLVEEMDSEGMKVLAAADDKSTYERIRSRGGKVFYNAPALILIAIKDPGSDGTGFIDCGIVAQNIVLAATSLGVANVHCGMLRLAFQGERSAEFKRKLKIPEGYEFGLGVLLGYAVENASPHIPDRNKIAVIG